MLWGWFDPMYLLFVAPAMLLALWAQFRVKSAYAEASQIPTRSGLSGAEAADAVLRTAGVRGVEIEPVGGFLSDHYVPGQHVLRLSPENYSGGRWRPWGWRPTRPATPSRTPTATRCWWPATSWCPPPASAAAPPG
jgi:hypothetical protein